MNMNKVSKAIVAVVALGAVSSNIALAGKSKQDIKELDSTVVMENAGAGSITINGGKATTVIGGASVKNGAEQKIGKMKTNVRMKNSGAGAIAILGGEASTNIGGAVAE